jgi:hypothetical protein
MPAIQNSSMIRKIASNEIARISRLKNLSPHRVQRAPPPLARSRSGVSAERRIILFHFQTAVFCRKPLRQKLVSSVAKKSFPASRHVHA